MANYYLCHRLSSMSVRLAAATFLFLCHCVITWFMGLQAAYNKIKDSKDQGIWTRELKKAIHCPVTYTFLYELLLCGAGVEGDTATKVR